jgi:hypothetical protein
VIEVAARQAARPLPVVRLVRHQWNRGGEEKSYGGRDRDDRECDGEVRNEWRAFAPRPTTT